MGRNILSVLTLLCVFTASSAQDWKLRRYEGTLGFGPTNFFSDLGGFSSDENLSGVRDFRLRQVRGNINAGVKYRITRRLSAKAGLSLGFLNGNDKAGIFVQRDYISNVFVLEPAVVGEYYFKRHIAEESFLFNDGKKKSFRGFYNAVNLYVFAGVGEVWYNISANDKLREVMISNNTPAKDRTEVLPFGLGTTINIAPNFNLGFEYGARYVFQDRLDGYAPQGSRARDFYHFLNFNFVYKKRTNIKGLPDFK